MTDDKERRIANALEKIVKELHMMCRHLDGIEKNMPRELEPIISGLEFDVEDGSNDTSEEM